MGTVSLTLSMRSLHLKFCACLILLLCGVDLLLGRTPSDNSQPVVRCNGKLRSYIEPCNGKCPEFSRLCHGKCKSKIDPCDGKCEKNRTLCQDKCIVNEIPCEGKCKPMEYLCNNQCTYIEEPCNKKCMKGLAQCHESHDIVRCIPK